MVTVQQEKANFQQPFLKRYSTKHKRTKTKKK